MEIKDYLIYSKNYMIEYKVVINEEQVEVSALHIPMPMYEKMNEVVLSSLLNKWFKEIDFNNNIIITDKEIEFETQFNNNESIKSINNGIEIIVIAYRNEPYFDIVKHRPRNRHTSNNNTKHFEK